VCYFLYIASPLTLSEIRSMLPDGVSADLAQSVEQAVLKPLLRGTQTVARLLVGRCSCDFVRQRHPEQHEDERHLRERYRRLGTPRALIIPALERHRAGARVPSPSKGWNQSLVDFVREHARNAGSTVYQLAFLPPPNILPPQQEGIREIALDRVTPELGSWLVEGSPVVVTR
jgi:hypothetical protein